MADNVQVINDWSGFKGTFWGYVFRSPFLRYLFGFYIFSNKHGAIVRNLIKKRLKHGGYVVDLGAGSGYYTIMSASINPGVKVSAVDLSETMLNELKGQVARKKLQDQVVIYHENVEKTSIASNTADFIIASNLFHELITPNELIKEMNRLLKKGGVIVVTEFVDNDFGRKFLSHHNNQVHGPYSANEIKQYFVDNGFSNIEVDEHHNRLLVIVHK